MMDFSRVPLEGAGMWLLPEGVPLASPYDAPSGAWWFVRRADGSRVLAFAEKTRNGLFEDGICVEVSQFKSARAFVWTSATRPDGSRAQYVSDAGCATWDDAVRSAVAYVGRARAFLARPWPDLAWELMSEARRAASWVPFGADGHEAAKATAARARAVYDAGLEEDARSFKYKEKRAEESLEEGGLA